MAGRCCPGGKEDRGKVLIYFLRAEQDSGFILTGYIKIGTTTRLATRVKQISREIGHVPTVLGVLDGGYADETALHTRFSNCRRFGEWFVDHADLLSLIETECQSWDGGDEFSTVKMDRGVIKLANMVAKFRDIPVAQYLTEMVKSQVQRDASKVGRQLSGKDEA